MAQPNDLPYTTRGVLQGIAAIAMAAACIAWIATVLPGSLQIPEVLPVASFAVSTEGVDGETGPLKSNESGDPITTEVIAHGNSGPDIVSLEDIQKNRTESVETTANQMNLDIKKGGSFAVNVPTGTYQRPTNQKLETAPTRNTSYAVELTTSIKFKKEDIGDIDSQAPIIGKEVRTFDGTAVNDGEVFMEGVENPNELFKDVDPSSQLRSVQKEPGNGIQRKDGSPKQVQEMVGSSYSVTGDVAHEAIGRQVAALDDLQMDGTAVAGVRVVFTRPEAEKDGEFYVDPRGNVFRKA